MPRYIVRTQQTFDVTYSVSADTPEAAYQEVVDDGGRVVLTDQRVVHTLAYEAEGTTVQEWRRLNLDATPTSFRIERPKSMPVVFDGWLLSNVDSRDFMDDQARQTRDRWSDLSIYKTTTGKWVVAQIGKTRETGGFRPGALVSICQTPPEVQTALMHRSGHWTPVTTSALKDAIEADPELATAREEHI